MNNPRPVLAALAALIVVVLLILWLGGDAEATGSAWAGNSWIG